MNVNWKHKIGNVIHLKISNNDLRYNNKEMYDWKIKILRFHISIWIIEPASGDMELANRDIELASRDMELARRNMELASRDIELASRDMELASRDIGTYK